MKFSNNRGFTLVEIISVVVILGTLFTALYIGAVPYMKRSRDVRRITDISSYMNTLDSYDKNFDTYPSVYGSGGVNNPGYCLSEMYLRPDYPGYSDRKFTALRNGATQPPHDPMFLAPIAACDMTGSYLYSRLNIGTSNQMAIVAARLELRSTANYGTGMDLLSNSSVDSVKYARKGSIPESAPDGLFVVFRVK